MKIVGGIGIGAAVVLMVIAALIAFSAAQMQNQVQAQTDVEKTLNDWSGQGKKIDAQIQGVVMLAGLFAAGAVLAGLAGMAFLIIGFVIPTSEGAKPSLAVPAPDPNFGYVSPQVASQHPHQHARRN